MPLVLARVLRSPSHDEEAWRSLWHLLATEGVAVSEASFAALPFLRDIAATGDTARPATSRAGHPATPAPSPYTPTRPRAFGA